MAELPIPLEALEDCGAILGRRGAGKSGTGRVLLEHELAAGRRCCAIDPKGDWWGIRMDKAGKTSGFDLPIFGGSHGDLALTEGMGEMLGRLVATHDLSCVVDLSGFPSQAAQRRFARDFATALYEHNRQPITLFVDEADQLAPQRVPADMARLLHAMESLIRLGRQRGIFMWMLTQRPQVLNKNLLSQAESLIAMKVTTPHDRGAIRDWMDAHDPDQAKEIEQQLAKLDVGEAFAWVPAADFLGRVRFPLFATYDSGRTPRHGETVEAVKLPSIDLSALQAALASVAKTEGDHPDDSIPTEPKAALKKGGEVGRMLKQRDDRIAELEAELAEARSDAGAWRAAARDATAALENAGARLNKIVEIASQAKAGVDASVPETGSRAEPVSRAAAGRSAAATAERMAVTAGETAPSRAARQRAAPEGPHPLAAKIVNQLEALAPAKFTWKQVASLLGYKPEGGYFRAGKRDALASGKLEEVDDYVSSTIEAEGLSHAKAYALWEAILPSPAPAIMERLRDAGELTSDQLAGLLGYEASGGYFRSGLKHLRQNGVITEAGARVKLADPLPGETP